MSWLNKGEYMKNSIQNNIKKYDNILEQIWKLENDLDTLAKDIFFEAEKLIMDYLKSQDVSYSRFVFNPRNILFKVKDNCFNLKIEEHLNNTPSVLIKGKGQLDVYNIVDDEVETNIKKACDKFLIKGV